MNTKIMSNKQEKRIARELNGKTTIASGATWIQKADVRNDQYLVEAKTTGGTYYTLSLNTWERIEQQATQDGLRTPIMCIDLNDGEESIALLSNIDLWQITDECGYESSNLYVGDILVKHHKKSIRITGEFMYGDFPQEVEPDSMYIRRRDFRLGTHELSMISWEDFLFLDKKLQEVRKEELENNCIEMYE